MFKKVLFISAVLAAGLLLFGTIDKSQADAAAELQQAEQYVEDEDYQQAEAIYKTIVTDYPGSDYALEAQKELTILYITWGRQPEAEAAYEKLLAEFSGNEGIAQAVCHIADKYRRLKKDEKAHQVYQYVVDNWPGSEEAVDTQARLVISNILLGDDPNTKAAVDKLLTEFSENKRLSRGFYKIAKAYGKLEKHEKARELYQYVVDNWPDSEHAVDAQAGLAISNIRLGDDPNAQAAIGKLLTEFSEFSENKRLPEGFCDIAEVYGGRGKHEKARELYQYVLDNWPGNKQTMDTQAGLAISYIGLGDDSNAQAAIDTLIADFKDHPDLSRAINHIEEGYYTKILAAETWVRENYLQPVEIWEKVLSEFPDFFYDDPDLYYFIGDCYRQLGKYEKAIEYYDIVAAKWTQNGYAVLSKVVVPRAEDDGTAGEALHETIDSLIVNFGDHPGLACVVTRSGHGYRRRANDARRAGLTTQATVNNFKAIVLYDRVINEFGSSPFTASAYFFSALVYRDFGRWQDALDCCNQLLDNWPEYKYSPWARRLAQACSDRLAEQAQ